MCRYADLGEQVQTGRMPVSTESRFQMLRHIVPVAAALSALVLASCGGSNGDPDPGTTIGDPASAVSITGMDTLKFSPTELTAVAGEIEVQLVCEPGVNHDVTIDGGDTVVECGAGQTETGTVTLEAGTYDFYCNVPGHRAAGMEGTLTVS